LIKPIFLARGRIAEEISSSGTGYVQVINPEKGRLNKGYPNISH
jgi:hypothetical protein